MLRDLRVADICATGSLLFVGLIGVFAVPFQIGALIDGPKLSATLAGVLGTAELAAMSLTSILIAPVLGRIPLRWCALAGIGLAVVGEGSTALTANTWLLSSARMMTGIGSGAVLAATTAIIATGAAPDAVMGLGLTFANVVFFALFLLTPRVLTAFDYQGLFVMLALFVLLAGASLPWLPGPRRRQPVAKDVSPESTIDRPRAIILVGGVLLLNVGLGAVWSFAERMGHQIGLSGQHIGEILSGCSIAMTAGSFGAGLVGDRFGHQGPLVVGSILCGIGCYATAMATGPTGYTAGLLVYNFCYLMIGPFVIVGVPSRLDASGRLAAAVGGFMWLAYAAGVSAGGLITDHASIKGIGTFALGGCLVAALAFFYVARCRPDPGAHTDR